MKGEADVIEFLVDGYGVDPGVLTEVMTEISRMLIFLYFFQDGRSPIILAVQRDQLDVVELLQNKYHQPLPTATDLENLSAQDDKTIIINLEKKLVP